MHKSKESLQFEYFNKINSQNYTLVKKESAKCEIWRLFSGRAITRWKKTNLTEFS